LRGPASSSMRNWMERFVGVGLAVRRATLGGVSGAARGEPEGRWLIGTD